ncbi:hypothetical protein HPB49_025099 [Dermacentor silvarum]|uniref:Uncharacterized protein n=1 Tax=Dermacentor silvarum TaxID=543639 RepID=A0ACB8C676_DERSI|nr:hypothetical protein HPB49_025099 [Dermacentor silvarum]
MGPTIRCVAIGKRAGCCFVTFYTRKSALDAQNDLHNMKTLPGVLRPTVVHPRSTSHLSLPGNFLTLVSERYVTPSSVG